MLAGSDSRALLKFACRLAEQAYLAERCVFVWLEDAPQLQSFDELLWTFADRAFVPHDLYSDPRQWRDTAVLLSCTAQPQQPFDMLLNLAAEVPASAAHAHGIAEVVDADEARRRCGRNRFRHYRDQRLTPETHNIGADDPR